MISSKPPSDVLTYFLLLDSLESVLSNPFFDIELRITEIISILLSLSLQSDFHAASSCESILSLKVKSSHLLKTVLRQCKSRLDLQQECCNMLLYSMLSENVSKYKFYGCITSLYQLGPQMNIEGVIRNFEAIFEKLEQISSSNSLDPSQHENFKLYQESK